MHVGWSWFIGHKGDITQVLILWALFYVALHFIRGTRGAGVLRGLVIIFTIAFVAVSFVTRIAGLEAIHYLLTQLLGVAALILIIVIFQPELRYGLIRLGSSPFLRSLFHVEEHVIREIVQAVSYLSRNKIGGLIVLARGVELGTFIERGIVLDAEVSSELLNAVFQPTSPLEDGAVIIQHQRIAAACCILPLTDNPALSRTLGTRHRAALGVTEESDAVAVVASEQTGQISVAVDGQLTRDLTPEALQNLLAGILAQTPDRREPQRAASEAAS